MASIILCDRLSTSTRRVRLDGVNLNSKVVDLKMKAAKSLEELEHKIDLVYCGQILDDNRTMEGYDLKSGVTVHVLRKKGQDEERTPDSMSKPKIQQVVTALQSALTNPAYRSTVEKMLAKPDTLENLVAATPGLENDPVALAMLQDPDLLAQLAEPAHIYKVIEAHPSLGQAAMMVATAVNEETTKAAAAAESRGHHSARATYSLDEMSDDEEMPMPRGPPAPITASQLAAALASAGNSQGASTSSPATARTAAQPAAQQPSSDQITADFFRQALLSAAGQAPNQPESGTTVTEAQLQQMRDMGITDESVARRALQASGGNIQAALEIIFGDGGGF